MVFLASIFLLFAAIVPSGEADGILDSLVAKCDAIDDEYMAGKTGTEARHAILRSLRGKIGPIEYVHSDVRLRPSTSAQDTAFGKTYTGSLKGPHVFPIGGKYIALVPDEFTLQIKKWAAEGLKGDSVVARAELASALFAEAYLGKGELNEAKMFLLYRNAAEAGNSGAMFMCAVCRYYGIGIPKDEAKALKMLQHWKQLSGTKSVPRDGWIARRFAVINRQ